MKVDDILSAGGRGKSRKRVGRGGGSKGKYADELLPDLILLDLNLPKKDGREVLSEIKEDPDLRRIPVVIMTISNSEEDILHTYDLHANSYITKPIDLEHFMDVFKSIENFWLRVVRLPSR